MRFLKFSAVFLMICAIIFTVACDNPASVEASSAEISSVEVSSVDVSSTDASSAAPVVAAKAGPVEHEFFTITGLSLHEGQTAPQQLPIVLVTSTEGMNGFYDAYGKIFDLEKNMMGTGYLDMISLYDGEFFKAHAVLLAVAGKGDFSPQSITMAADGKVTISVKDNAFEYLTDYNLFSIDVAADALAGATSYEVVVEE